ncbi:hypothetical protein [Streptomyces sp. NPDC087437]|uniref:hypothetical protein n=1 Tax=Streptomyces sp. NPDC087437 TaxID=3365789 RepID=UPI0038135A23
MGRPSMVQRLTAAMLREAPWLTPRQAATISTAVVDKAAPGPGRPSPTPDELDMDDADDLGDFEPAPGSADEKDPEAWRAGPGRGGPASSFHLAPKPLHRLGNDTIQLGEPWTFGEDGQVVRAPVSSGGPHLRGPEGPAGPEGPHGPEGPEKPSSWVRPETELESNWLKNKPREPQFSATAFFRSRR